MNDVHQGHLLEQCLELDKLITDCQAKIQELSASLPTLSIFTDKADARILVVSTKIAIFRLRGQQKVYRDQYTMIETLLGR